MKNEACLLSTLFPSDGKRVGWSFVMLNKGVAHGSKHQNPYRRWWIEQKLLLSADFFCRFVWSCQKKALPLHSQFEKLLFGWPVRLSVRTRDFHSLKRSSTLLRATTFLWRWVRGHSAIPHRTPPASLCGANQQTLLH